MRQLWQNQQGKFTRVPNVPAIGPGIWGDFDNDGFLDLFGWSGKGTLLRNQQGKSFETVKGLPEKIPLTLASGGMSKLAAILLSIPDQAGGVILIDEIENGFYYRRLSLVWKAILDSARAYDCQIFASSHSAECLNAAAALAEESPDEFLVIRTVLKDGEAKIRHFGGDKFVDATAENIEIR